MVRYDASEIALNLPGKRIYIVAKKKNTRKHHFELPFHKLMKPRNHFTFLELCK